LEGGFRSALTIRRGIVQPAPWFTVVGVVGNVKLAIQGDHSFCGDAPNHVRHIYDKLHVHSRSEAVAKALQSGILR
jgi:hypothetical protein